jgi:hypothetical protein
MGHKLPVVPRFRSAFGARRALLETGYKTLPDLLDAHFGRIGPAFMRLGDVMAFPGDAGFESLVVRASTNKWIGWHEDADGCCILDADMDSAIGAWRL